MSLNQDLKKIDKLLKRRSGDRFKMLYKFTTENISGYINEFDFKDKNLLTVGSSGDQAINANMYGCGDVTVVDLNGYSKYFFDLKKAAIMMLDYEKFLYYFMADDKKEKMQIDFYRKLREILRSINLDSLVLWDYIYDNYSTSQINNMFNYHTGELNNIVKFNSYLSSEENYNIEKSKIGKFNIKFINTNILKSDKIFTLERFDNINLSNVYSYADNKYKFKKFKKGIYELVKILNNDGKMLVAYLYGTSSNNSLIDFATDNILEDLLFCSFQGVRGIANNTNDTDTAVIYKKTIDKNTLMC